MKTQLPACTLAILLGASFQVSHAQITSIGPFSGTLLEDWESFPTGWYSPPGGGYPRTALPIMGGHATLTAYVILVFNSGTFNLGSSGGPILAPDGSHLAYLQDLPGLSFRLDFDKPVWSFGAYWGSYTDGPFPNPVPIRLDCFDASGGKIGATDILYSHSSSPDGLLDWHGWAFPAGVKAIEVVQQNGAQIIVDGLQANVPEPAGTALLAGLGLLGFGVWRRTRG